MYLYLELTLISVCVCSVALDSLHCDPMDCSLPGSSDGFSQVSLLERVAISSSMGSSWLRDQTCVSYVSCISGGFITTEPPGKPEVCSRERIYTPSTRVIYTLTLWVRRQENKSQIYLPEGERLRTFMGKAEEWGVRGKLTGNKQVSWSSFYTGATKLNASLQGERLEKCPEDGVFGPLMLKGHQEHSGMSRWRAGGPVLTGWSSD